MNAIPGTNPCKDCKNRTATCHGECQVYLDWSDNAAKFNAKVRKQKIYEGYSHNEKPVKIRGRKQLR